VYYVLATVDASVMIRVTDRFSTCSRLSTHRHHHHQSTEGCQPFRILPYCMESTARIVNTGLYGQCIDTHQCSFSRIMNTVETVILFSPHNQLKYMLDQIKLGHTHFIFHCEHFYHY